MLSSTKKLISLIIFVLSINNVKSETVDDSTTEKEINVIELFNVQTKMLESLNTSIQENNLKIDELKESMKTTNDEVKQEPFKDYLKQILENNINKIESMFDTKAENVNQNMKENLIKMESLLTNQTVEMKQELKEDSKIIDNHMSKIESMLKNITDKIQEKSFINSECNSDNNGKLENLQQLNIFNYDEHFNCLSNCKPMYDNCNQAMLSTSSRDGIFLLNSDLKPFYAYCERKDNNIWTVIQRHEDSSVDFNRNWNDYKNGFGVLKGNFWLGLERLHHLTKHYSHELYIRLIDENGDERFAKYKMFSISNEADEYKLTIGGYSGNAGDGLAYHNGMKFSTYDNCNDNNGCVTRECAKSFKGGWWFAYSTIHICYDSHLNGVFNLADGDGTNGIAWGPFSWRLKFSEMMIRPL